MTYTNISHNLESISAEQERKLKIVEILLSNLNSLKPSHVVLNKLQYVDDTFKLTSLGFMHAFLLKDIEKALLEDLESHKLFILENVKERIKDYNYNQNDTKYINTKINLESIIKYYKNYPLYIDTEAFINYVNDLDEAISKEFIKIL